MNPLSSKPNRHDGIIAGLLWYGTLIASAVITIGIILGAAAQMGDTSGLAQTGYALIKLGVVIFVLLPIIRVALMLVMFAHARDYIYTAIAALVLAIIGIGVLLGL
ncbi:uncharacterized protein DUF1634 [Advenella incenata]|jgi:uncharacterized membrane protein|uniref:Uncharacterized protein DUF1634 n=1 Tax=Advenella incenata TaxID=267800 RepID=A0A4Q7VTV2_9BURK|nr:DUF1634 domain-containing protein [Advenella incenata]RZT99757.1 uncharacterized protein DUF1634 [Advenella incenata]